MKEIYLKYIYVHWNTLDRELWLIENPRHNKPDPNFQFYVLSSNLKTDVSVQIEVKALGFHQFDNLLTPWTSWRGGGGWKSTAISYASYK